MRPKLNRPIDWRWLNRVGSGVIGGLSPAGTPSCQGKLLVVLAMRKEGLSSKRIYRETGVAMSMLKATFRAYGDHAPRNRQFLTMNSIHCGTWTEELDSFSKQEDSHDAWWTKTVLTHEERKAKALEDYYADHERNKKRQAATAKARHARIKHTPEYKAKVFARNQIARISRQVRSNQKSLRNHEYLGCTYAHAAAYLSSLLPTGWTWDNYGTVWEIDHALQLSDGQLIDQVHMRRVCHYTNLRPMAVKANRTRPKGIWAARNRAPMEGGRYSFYRGHRPEVLAPPVQNLFESI